MSNVEDRDVDNVEVNENCDAGDDSVIIDELENIADILQIANQQNYPPEEIVYFGDGLRGFRKVVGGPRPGIDKITVKKDGEVVYHRICSLIEVYATSCLADSTGWSYCIKFTDRRGMNHDVTVPNTELHAGTNLRQMLSHRGVTISPGLLSSQYLVEFIQGSSPEHHINNVDKIGWIEGQRQFVLPDIVVGALENTTFKFNSGRWKNPYNQKGTLEQWQDTMRLLAGNSRLILAVSLAFVGPLLKMANEEGGGIHFYGPSSTGKTTALFVAGAVWGGSDTRAFLNSWNTTENAIEGMAVKHNNTLLVMDEISEGKNKSISPIAYGVTNGEGKSSRLLKIVADLPLS